HSGSAGDRDERGVNIYGVVAESRIAGEVNRIEIQVFGMGGILGHAVEIVETGAGGDGREVGAVPHAERNDHVFAGGGDRFDERTMAHAAAGDFVAFHLNVFTPTDSLHIEHRGHEFNSGGLAGFRQFEGLVSADL